MIRAPQYEQHQDDLRSHPSRVWIKKVPSIAFEIEEHGEPTVWLIAGRRYELHTAAAHPLMRRLEVFDAQERSDAPRELPTDGAYLVLAVRTREQHARLASRGPNDDLALGTAVVGERRRVLDEVELEDVDDEADRGVVVPHNERDQIEVSHRTRLEVVS